VTVDPPTERTARRVDLAMALGVAALLCVFVPAIGELLAVPAALVAIGLGLVELRRSDGGWSVAMLKACVGVLTAAVALLIVILSLAMHHTI